jgi:hypothetical protein
MILVPNAVDAACGATAWLRQVPEWSKHPINPAGTVSRHIGPTILSGADCVLQSGYYRQATAANRPRRGIARAAGRGQFAVPPGGFTLDAGFEFALAGNYWPYGA